MQDQGGAHVRIARLETEYTGRGTDKGGAGVEGMSGSTGRAPLIMHDGLKQEMPECGGLAGFQPELCSARTGGLLCDRPRVE
jgi:hypothetical protein